MHQNVSVENQPYYSLTVQGPPNLWQHNFILKLFIFNFML